MTHEELLKKAVAAKESALKLREDPLNLTNQAVWDRRIEYQEAIISACKGAIDLEACRQAVRDRAKNPATERTACLQAMRRITGFGEAEEEGHE